MISQRAKIGFDQLFPRCLQESLRSDSHPTWSIQPVNKEIIGAKRFIMITISSYDFRMIILLHYSSDTASIKHVSDSLHISPEALSTEQYQDYLAEVGNLLSGAIRRRLSHSFPHLGTSSPNHLMSESLQYIQSYPIDYVNHQLAYTTDGTEFYSSLYVSSSSELDFDPTVIAKIENQMESEMGTMELF